MAEVVPLSVDKAESAGGVTGCVCVCLSSAPYVPETGIIMAMQACMCNDSMQIDRTIKKLNSNRRKKGEKKRKKEDKKTKPRISLRQPYWGPRADWPMRCR